MSTDKYGQTLLRIAADVCQNLFRDYGVSLRPCTDDHRAPSPMLLCGVVGFSGKGLRGSAIIGSSSEVLLASNPAKNPQDRDWVGELANQFVGRIENELVKYGVEIFITTPVTLRGEHILPLGQHGLPRLVLEGPQGKVWVWLEVRFASTFRMLDKPDPRLGGPSEGETMLF